MNITKYTENVSVGTRFIASCLPSRFSVSLGRQDAMNRVPTEPIPVIVSIRLS